MYPFNLFKYLIVWVSLSTAHVGSSQFIFSDQKAQKKLSQKLFPGNDVQFLIPNFFKIFFDFLKFSLLSLDKISLLNFADGFQWRKMAALS